jgi:hypothetical protein
MQDFWDTIKSPNLQTMHIEGGEIEAKGMDNLVKKIIEENISNLN